MYEMLDLCGAQNIVDITSRRLTIYFAPSQSKKNFYNLSYQSRKKYIQSSKNTDNNANIESSPETLEGLFVSIKDN